MAEYADLKDSEKKVRERIRSRAYHIERKRCLDLKYDMEMAKEKGGPGSQSGPCTMADARGTARQSCAAGVC
eukprot:6955583-Pyramimonas_sp.AAC.1